MVIHACHVLQCLAVEVSLGAAVVAAAAAVVVAAEAVVMPVSRIL